jgi:hypothetical protein
MNRLAALETQAEFPLWAEPVAIRIADLLKDDLAANTRELMALRTQLHDLVETQLLFLESLQSQLKR